jgi:hypothetical protein
MALDATPGGISANSYVDVAYADEYFSTRLYSDVWTETAPKENALITATQILEAQITWDGIRARREQALQWPRSLVLDRDGRYYFGNVTSGFYYPSDTIPDRVKKATCELAISLIEENRREEDPMKGFASLALGPMKVVADKTDRKKTLPETVLAILGDIGTVTLQSAFVELQRG